MASEDKSISQFPTAVSILMTTLLFGSVVDQTSSSGYDSVKILVSDLAEAILGDFIYTQDLDTDVKTIFGAINSIRTLSGTTTPNNADGANGQIYVKHDNSYDVTGLYVKLNNAWHEISTGGGGGGASVDMGTTVPSDASGSNGDLYVQYDGTSYDFVDLFVKINNSWRKAPYSRVVSLTQAQYDLITPDPTTLYIITDAQSSYQTKSDNSLATNDKTIVGAINEVHNSIGADVYDSSSSYVVGDYCIYNNTLYRCKANTTGAFDSSKWDSTTITSLIESLKGEVDEIGTIVYGTSIRTTVPNAWGAMFSLALTKGKWLVTSYLIIESNSTGYRAMGLTLTSGDSTVHAIANAVNGNVTQVEHTTILDISADSETYYLNAIQTSGSNTLNCSTRFCRAIRIA